MLPWYKEWYVDEKWWCFFWGGGGDFHIFHNVDKLYNPSLETDYTENQN